MDTAVSKPPRSTGSWALKWLGILWGACVLISLVKGGFAIDLHGLPLAIYEQYAWMRDTLFWPIAKVFAWLGWSMPAWAKDVVMAYGLLSAAIFRGLVEMNEQAGEEIPSGFFQRMQLLATTTVMWPLVAIALLNFGLGHTDDEVAGSHRALATIARHLIIVVVCAVAFFFWNHLENVLGPV